MILYRTEPECFDMAKAYRDTFRPILPVGYSTMRGNQPVPPTIPLVREVANETDDEKDRNENAADKNANDAKPILVAAQMGIQTTSSLSMT